MVSPPAVRVGYTETSTPAKPVDGKLCPVPWNRTWESISELIALTRSIRVQTPRRFTLA